jgi:hypothetical protein
MARGAGEPTKRGMWLYEGKLGMHTEFRCGNLGERDYLEYLGKCGRIILT